jgi:thioredoxin-related protein
MRFLFRFLILWLAVLMQAQAAPGDAFFDTSLGDYVAELKTTQLQGKQGILLVVEVEGCPFCKRMRAQVLSRPEVQQYFHRHFNIFSLDMNGSVTVVGPDGTEQTEKSLVRALKVRGTPSFLFFATDGREMARYTGVTRDTETFMALGQFVAEGHWKKSSFEQFHPDPDKSRR